MMFHGVRASTQRLDVGRAVLLEQARERVELSAGGADVVVDDDPPVANQTWAADHDEGVQGVGDLGLLGCGQSC